MLLQLFGAMGDTKFLAGNVLQHHNTSPDQGHERTGILRAHCQIEW